MGILIVFIFIVIAFLIYFSGFISIVFYALLFFTVIAGIFGIIMGIKDSDLGQCISSVFYLFLCGSIFLALASIFTDIAEWFNR